MGDQGPIFFHKDYEEPYGFLCQWYASRFMDDESGILFQHAEQYMMYHRALTFSDTKSANEILLTPSPRICKRLGHSIKDFDAEVWNKIKLQVVERGSYLKYTKGAKELKQKLLATKDRELVEASPFDRVWGVGFSVEQCRKGKKAGAGRDYWGENLLGKALMAARKKIRDEEEALEANERAMGGLNIRRPPATGN